MKRRGASLACLLPGASVAAYPLVELWMACRRTSSEKCVWYGALLPVSLTVSVVLGLVAAGIGLLIVRASENGRT